MNLTSVDLVSYQMPYMPLFATLQQHVEPLIQTAAINSSSLCQKIQGLWQSIQSQSFLAHDCAEKECRFPQISLSAGFQNYTESLCTLSITPLLDKQSFTGNVTFEGEKIKINAQQEKNAFEIKSNLKDSVEARWNVSTIKDNKTELSSQVKGSFKVGLDPISFNFKNKDSEFFGTCITDQNKEYTCEVSNSGWKSSVFGGKVVIKPTTETSENEKTIKLNVRQQTAFSSFLPSYTPLVGYKEWGTIELKFNPYTGEFKAAGKIDKGDKNAPLLDGQISCSNHPHTICSADLKIGSTKIDAQGSIEPNNFGGKLAINGSEWLSGSASITTTETEALYSAKAMYDGSELEIKAKDNENESELEIKVVKSKKNKLAKPETPNA